MSGYAVSPGHPEASSATAPRSGGASYRCKGEMKWGIEPIATSDHLWEVIRLAFPLLASFKPKQLARVVGAYRLAMHVGHGILN
jgi:hypothetical protein